IGKAVSKVITKIRKPIDKIVNKVIDKIVKMSAKLLKKSKSVANKVKDKLYGWLKLKKNFTDPAGNHHSLIFKGNTPNAQLIVRSTPKAIPAFISEAKNAHKNNSVKLNKVSQIESYYQDIASQQRLSQRNKKDEAKQKQVGDKVNELMDKINKLLPQVFPDSDWGDQSNPLFIDWPKRASINYDTLYFGPKTKKWIPQESLKAARQNTAEKNKIKNKLSKKERDAWAENDNVIEDYKPHQLEALPDGGAILGLSSEWHVYKGKKFVLKAGKTTGGGQLNKILKKYGFSPSKENEGKGLDADHVIEMQLGGKNLMRNLWPLSAPENRSSGSLISSITLKNKKNNENIKISEVKSEAQKRPIWVEINKLKAKS
ncbi:MAG: hypothetical protein KAI17_17045, partial [Thiotrichaceae bacterium]|nr:hypothetical protein [Thiotrichaceae bacterium]